MKSFLIKTILLVTLIISGLFFLELESRKLDNSFFKVKKDYLYNNYDQLQGMIFGPSHIWRAINPEWLDYPTSSLAFSGSAINVDYKLFDQHKDAPALKFVIFDLSAGYKERVQSDAWIKAKKLYYYFGIKSNHFSLQENFYVRYPIWDDIKRLSGEEDMPDQNNLTTNQWGFVTVIPEQKNLFKRANFDKAIIEERGIGKRTINRHTLDRFDESIAQFSEDKILDIITQCKSRRIKVIFVSPPKYYLYNQKLQKEHISRRAALLDNIIDDKDVFFMDLDKIFEDDPTYFYNVNHVNTKGAKVVTSRINEQLHEILSK